MEWRICLNLCLDRLIYLNFTLVDACLRISLEKEGNWKGYSKTCITFHIYCPMYNFEKHSSRIGKEFGAGVNEFEQCV